jgi:hypothetical protein
MPAEDNNERLGAEAPALQKYGGTPSLSSPEPFGIMDRSATEPEVQAVLNATERAIEEHLLHQTGAKKGLLNLVKGRAPTSVVRFSSHYAGTILDNGLAFAVFSFALNEKPRVLWVVVARDDVRLRVIAPRHNFVYTIAVDNVTGSIWNANGAIKSRQSPTSAAPNCVVMFCILNGSHYAPVDPRLDVVITPQLCVWPTSPHEQLQLVATNGKLYQSVNPAEKDE